MVEPKTNWDDTNADPVADIKEAIRIMKTQTGLGVFYCSSWRGYHFGEKCVYKINRTCSTVACIIKYQDRPPVHPIIN